MIAYFITHHNGVHVVRQFLDGIPLDEDDWIQCRIVNTDVWGHVPSSYVQAVTRYKVDYDYGGNAEEGELTLQEGEVGDTISLDTPIQLHPNKLEKRAHSIR